MRSGFEAIFLEQPLSDDWVEEEMLVSERKIAQEIGDMEEEEPYGPPGVNAEWRFEEDDVSTTGDACKDDRTTCGAGGETLSCYLLNDGLNSAGKRREARRAHSSES